MSTPVAKAPPVLVEVDDEDPVSVVVEEPEKPSPITTKSGELSLPPTTTVQEDIVVAGQRLINILWEVTQSTIAITVVVATMIKAFILVEGNEIPTIMAVAFGTVVGFYFGRTNHQNIGGIGHKTTDSQPHRGR